VMAVDLVGDLIRRATRRQYSPEKKIWIVFHW
jgi:hypothetical protein